MRHFGPRDGTSGRLPRTTFVDDPFFHHDPFDGFSRSPQPTRRFGSTPRLVDDDFFEDFHSPSFGSLPRRPGSRSPRPPTDRGAPPTGNMNSGSERSIPVQRASPNGANANQQPPPAPKKSASKAAVEINNANVPSSYTNGQLNPDRNQANSDSLNAEPRSRSNSVRSQQSAPAGVEQSPSSSPKREQSPIPMPDIPSSAPISDAKTKRSTFMEKKTSVDAGCSEQLIHLLDEAERRVEQLREMAATLEQEKEQLLATLSNVKLNAEILRLGQGDREDIDATADRILKRCKAVEVSVSTPRNAQQNAALDDVNKLIKAVTDKMQGDLRASKETIERYLNACCPDDEPGPIDQRFQSRVIECTADDQKKIRRKLTQLIEQIERAERVMNPEH